MEKKYPTKEEILKEIEFSNCGITFNPEVKLWKQNHYNDKWKTNTIEEKRTAIEILINELEKKKQFLTPTEKIAKIRWSDTWECDIEKHIIYGDINTPSIISALHEYGHHIFGSSELKACAFSINLFKKNFPTVYERLVWEGHMLKTL